MVFSFSFEAFSLMKGLPRSLRSLAMTEKSENSFGF